MLMSDKTSFSQALRPFSLIVALATCGLGISLAIVEGSTNHALAALVLFTGILLQVAVNLINDHRDLESHSFTSEQQLYIQKNTQVEVL